MKSYIAVGSVSGCYKMTGRKSFLSTGGRREDCGAQEEGTGGWHLFPNGNSHPSCFESQVTPPSGQAAGATAARMLDSWHRSVVVTAWQQ